MAKGTVRDEDWALVPFILRAEKKIEGSIKDLMIRLRGHQDAERGANRRDWVHEQPLNYAGSNIRVRLRICAGLRSSTPESWTAAIIVFNERIDGICHHVKAPDGRGGIVRGWHRHEWNSVARSCKNYRNELPTFDPGDSMESFILMCCREFGVILEQEGGANG